MGKYSLHRLYNKWHKQLTRVLYDFDYTFHIDNYYQQNHPILYVTSFLFSLGVKENLGNYVTFCPKFSNGQFGKTVSQSTKLPIKTNV